MAILAHCIGCSTEYSMKKHEEGCPKCDTPLKACKRFRVNVSTPQGKRITRTVNGNLTLARRVEAKIKTDVSEGKFFNIRKAPFLSEIWEQYSAWAAENKKSWRDDVSRWKWHVKAHIDGKKMDQVSPSDIDKILNNMKKYSATFLNKEERSKFEGSLVYVNPKEVLGGKHAAATKKQVLVLIKRVYNWAIQRDLYFGPNPANKVEPPKVQNEVTECLEEEKVENLLGVLEHWTNRRAALVVKFSLYTGLRQDEVMGLEWKDVDSEKGFVKLPDPKGNPTTLPICGEAIDVLREAMDLMPSEGCPWVFPNKNGARRVSFHKIWSRIRDKAGIPKHFRFHDLRHTFASYLASSGEVDLYTIQKLLNQQSPQMTQRYAHLLDEALRRGANVTDKVLGNKRGEKTDSTDQPNSPPNPG